MANTFDDQQIKELYAQKLAAETEKINADYLDADKKINEEKLKAQQTTDANLNRTAVEAQKADMNRQEMYNAYGLSSGARAQARLASENQTRSDMATLRQQLQDTEAALERERTLLGEQYASAIRQAQQQNDLALTQALYDAAQKEDDRIREDQRIANQNAWQAEQNQLDRDHQAAQNQAGWEFSASEAQKEREHQATQSQNQYNWQATENEKNRTYDQDQQEKADQKEKEEKDLLLMLEAAQALGEEYGDYSLYAQLAGLSPEQVGDVTKTPYETKETKRFQNGIVDKATFDKFERGLNFNGKNYTNYDDYVAAKLEYWAEGYTGYRPTELEVQYLANYYGIK